MRHTRFQGAIVRDDLLLLIKHYSHASDRSYWVFPGGGIEPDESEVECVVREMREETGLDVEVERLLVDERTPSDRFYRRQKTYLCRAVEGDPAPGSEPETDNFDIVDVGWFDLGNPESWRDRITDDQWVLPAVWEVCAELGYPGNPPPSVRRIETLGPPAPRRYPVAPSGTTALAERALVVRASLPADVESVLALLANDGTGGSAPRWPVEHDVLAGTALLAEADGVVVGAASSGEQRRACHAAVPWECRGRAMTLHCFVVAEDAAGTGVEPALLAAVEAEAERLTYDTVRIDAFAAGTVGTTFLERRGYRQAGLVDSPGGGMCYEARIEDVRTTERKDA